VTVLRVFTGVVAAVSLGVCQTTAPAQGAQQSAGANLVEFEVASVKLAPPREAGVIRFGPSGGPGSSNPGLVRCVCTVSSLVLNAFGIANYQLSGPAWLSTELAVEAKVPPGATVEQARLMMQKLLADRVKLAFHWTTQPMQGQELVVAKDGPKLQESVEGQPPSVVSADSSQKVTLGNGVTVRVGAQIPTTGIMSLTTPDHLTSVRGRQTTMGELAAFLAGVLKGPVTDRTGLKGKYDFTLSYALTLAPPSPPSESQIPVATAPLPSLAEALQKLGLKLDAERTTVKVLVIDHLEKTPIEN
jgi:uncharacterized protein (TIGR03435 family)